MHCQLSLTALLTCKVHYFRIRHAWIHYFFSRLSDRIWGFTVCIAHMLFIYLILVGPSHNPWTSSSFLELNGNVFLLSASFVWMEITSHTWWKWSHKWPESPIIKSAICIVLGAKKNQCAEGISPSEDLMMSFWTTALHTA